MLRTYLCVGVVMLSGCAAKPLRIDYQTADQVSICRDTVEAEFQDAEDLAANFCAARGMLPRLAGTDRCSRRSVRYNYVCTAVHY